MMAAKLRVAWKPWMTAVMAALAMLTILVIVASNDAIMSSAQRSLATISCGILNLLGQDTVVVGTTVQSTTFGITVVTACTGAFLTGLFLIAVVAFPSRWRSKLVGVGIGVAGIFLVNIVRLVSLYFIGVHWPGFLHEAHQLIWQSLMIVISVALWLVWAGRWAYAPRKR
jgi:exosortase/archaeosortase family protein